MPDNVIYLTEDFIPVEKDDPRMAMVKVRQPDGKVVFGFPEKKVLFHQTFDDHKGRPGQVGGSLPRSSSVPVADEEDYSRSKIVEVATHRTQAKTSNFWISPDDSKVIGETHSGDQHYEISDLIVGKKETTYGSYNEYLKLGAIRLGMDRRITSLETNSLDTATLKRVQSLVDEGKIEFANEIEWAGWTRGPGEPVQGIITASYSDFMSAKRVIYDESSFPELFMNKKLFQQGGEGSGHTGHAGRPGRRGGSLPRGVDTIESIEEEEQLSVSKAVEEKFENFKKRAKLSEDLTVQQFGRNTWGNYTDEETGLTTTLDSISTVQGRPFIKFQGKVLNRGEYEGHWERHLYPDSGEVYNDLFSIGQRMQGSGFGGRFYAYAEEQLMKSGVTKIKLFANLEVGGYAWAKLGFDFEHEWDAGSMNESFLSFWDKKYPGVSIPSKKTILSPWEIASLQGPDGARVGKEFLVGRSWNGVKLLKKGSTGFEVGEIYYRSKGYK